MSYQDMQEFWAADMGLQIVVCPECGTTETIGILEDGFVCRHCHRKLYDNNFPLTPAIMPEE